MTRPRIILVAVSVGLIAICAGLPLISTRTRGTYPCDGVPIEAGEIHDIRTMLNVHESPVGYLSIFGRTYRNVKGGPPYYLALPESHAIVFMTGADRGMGEVTVHFIDLPTREHLSVAGLSSDFGTSMGYGDDDSAQMDGPDRLVVSRSYRDRVHRATLNVKRGTIERETETTFGEGGAVVSQSERVGGRGDWTRTK